MLKNSNCKIYSFEKNERNYVNIFDREYLLSGSPEVTMLSNGVILSTKQIDGIDYGGVLTDDLKFYTGLTRDSYSTERQAYAGEIRSSYPINEDEILQSDEEVIFGGVLFGHFGHMITEGVSRLWWVIENCDNNDKIVFVSAGRGFEKYMYEILELCNIPKERIIMLQKPTRFKKIIIPDQAVYIRKGYYKEWRVAHKCMMKNALVKMQNKSLPRKIYFTKRLYVSGNCTSNENYFESFYERKGYKIIEPEKLSPTEKIATLANASEYAAISSTVSLFALFLREDANITMLVKNSDYMIDYNIMVHAATKHLLHYNIVDVGLSFLPVTGVHGVFFLGVTPCWKEYVNEYFGGWTDIDEMPAEAYEQYLRDWTNYYYEHPDRFHHDMIDYSDGFDIFKKLCEVLDDKTVNRSDYSTHEEIAKLLKK